MNGDFHYYATYCAAFLAGYSHEESLKICYSAQLVDHCTRTFLSKVHGPMSAATTQLSAEMINAKTDIPGLQDITRIWASFHFLPGDLYAEKKWCTKRYRSKYRLICNSDSDLMVDTVNLAKNKSLQSVGVSMHVLADTWAHKYFAGTPSLVINNTNFYFYELFGEEEKQIKFRHSTSIPDDLENSIYTSSIYQSGENSIMNLGHGRAGHLPDYSFIRYKYLPAWKGYEEILKDNPDDFIHAFAQMVCAMKYIRGQRDTFEKGDYDWDGISSVREKAEKIINTRQLDASDDWKALGEELSGETVEQFDLTKYEEEYINAPEEEKNNTYLGKFFLSAMAQKSMVTNRIYSSKNMLAGYSIDYHKKGFKGNKDFKALVEEKKEGGSDE